MNTTRNRATVLAISLRAAVKALRQSTATAYGFGDGGGSASARRNAIEWIEDVAEELEKFAATPEISEREAIYRECADIADRAREDGYGDARQIRDRILARMAAPDPDGGTR